MKFSSSENPSHKKTNKRYTTNPKDHYSSKVKIPNYTTPVNNTSQPYFEVNKRQAPIPPVNNRMPDNYNYNNNWNDHHMPENNNNMYKPNDSMYNSPVGVPLMPLYGYDNYEDAEKDWAYFRQLHPSTAKIILREVDNECDKLEYDGSCMFDEYPDQVYLGGIVDRIYNNIKNEIEEPLVYGENIKSTSNCNFEDYEIESSEEGLDSESVSSNTNESVENHHSVANNQRIETKQYRRDNRRNNRNPRRSNNWLRDFVEILLYQEMINRRRRYRSRRRWF